MDLKEDALLIGGAGSHWYYRSKLSAARHMIGQTASRELLDVGSGSAYFARELVRTGAFDHATCVDPGYPKDSRETLGTGSLDFCRGIEHSPAGVVLMMDVLEHVEDDVGLVREYIDKVESGTRFVVSVPAFQWMWSGHDVFLGHYRRYTLASLEACLGNAGLELEGGCYFYGAVLPLAVVQRMASRASRGAPQSQMGPQHPMVDRVLGAICSLESGVFKLNRLGGLSVFAAGRKP